MTNSEKEAWEMCEILYTGLREFNIPRAISRRTRTRKKGRWQWKHELTTLQANGINLKSKIRMFLERWRMRESNMKRFAQLYQIQAKCLRRWARMVVVSERVERFWRSLKPMGYRDRLCCPKWITICGKCWLRQFPFTLVQLPPPSYRLQCSTLCFCNLIKWCR